MDGPWLPNAAFYFLMAMPTSMVAWTIFTLSMGLLRERHDQPTWFTFIAVRLGTPNDWPKYPPDWPMIGFAVAMWVFFNAIPAYVLLKWPYGWAGQAEIVTYFVAQAVWVWRLRVAISRARSAHQERR